MEFQHTPVMLKQCIDALSIKPEGVYVDGTIGGAGHSIHIAGKLSKGGTLIGIDRDRDALEVAEGRLRESACRKYFVQANFADIRSAICEKGLDTIDGALLDIGVSSPQLDDASRGFSYMHDAPLDMRMNREDRLTAYDVINGYDKGELSGIISKYGEERFASRIASFIVREREKKPIGSTGELVDIIKSAIPASARRSGPHPGKRTFQAIRIEVNDELGQLERAIDEYLDVMAPGGRLCIITFHSLEDRIVKQKFQKRANPCTCPPEFPVCVCGKKADIKIISRKPVVPEDKELEENPRSRSAKLRVCEKL